MQARIMLNYMMLLHKRKHTQQHTTCRHYMNAGMQHGALYGTAPCRQAGRQAVGYSWYPELSQAQITEQLCLSTSGGSGHQPRVPHVGRRRAPFKGAVVSLFFAQPVKPHPTIAHDVDRRAREMFVQLLNLPNNSSL